MSFEYILMYGLIGLALVFAGFRMGEQRMKDNVLDLLDFFAEYLRKGDARFIQGRGGPADIVEELGKALEEEL